MTRESAWPPRLVGSFVHPAARVGQVLGQHPVEEDAVSNRAAEAAQPWSHGGHDDARLRWEELAELGDGAPKRVDLRAKLAGSDPEPEPGGIDPEAVDLRRDPRRLMPIEGQDSDAELEPWRGRGEMRERLQTGGGRLVIRPQ